jgi:hypothetical protein
MLDSRIWQDNNGAVIKGLSAELNSLVETSSAVRAV